MAAAAKERIMAHMNADHPDSLEDYLSHYNRITATPGSAKMIDLDLDSIKIEYTNTFGNIKTSTVKISPPMSSLAESRVRLVAMAEEATGKSFHQPPDMQATSAAPSISHSPPKSSIGWTFPGLEGYLTFALLSFGWWACSLEYPLSRGGPIEKFLPGIIVEFGRNFREQIFAFMIGIHLIEASIVARKCIENGASMSITALWTVNCFFEGGPAIARINKVIKEKEKGR
jgi:hypothetical protein